MVVLLRREGGCVVLGVSDRARMLRALLPWLARRGGAAVGLPWLEGARPEGGPVGESGQGGGAPAV